MPESTKSATATPTAAKPILIDLGRKKRRQINKLRNGGGPLLRQVIEVVDEFKQEGKIAESTQPLIVIVREKRRKLSRLPLPFLG